jgi:nitrogenase molybdenum-iron protein alpha chain
MLINLKEIGAETRENRLGSITGYFGTLHDLAGQSQCGMLKDRDRCFTQSSSCNSNCALGQLGSILNVAVINHAPSGCTAFAGRLTVKNHQVAWQQKGIPNNTVIVGTDMNEQDTIFGSVDSLAGIIREVYNRYHPEAIFIGTSCVTGIIGEDVDTVVNDLKDEIPVPIVPVYCEGFKSRIWATGFDLADHAVLTGIVKPPEQKRNIINFKNFNNGKRKEIAEIFARFGVEPLFLYTNSKVEELSHLSESLATVCICGSLGTYLGAGLEQAYGVPYIETLNPLGVIGFETWLREIGRVIHKEKEVEAYIAEERVKFLPQIEEIKKELKGLRAVIGMGPGFGFEIARVLEELGVEVVWQALWHFDKQHDNNQVPAAMRYMLEKPRDIKLSVADQQNHELLNILNRYKPDVYFCRHPGSTIWAIKQGIPAIHVEDEYMVFGYQGTLDFAYTILDSIRNRSLEQNLAARVKLPYTDWWYAQNASYFYRGDPLEGDSLKENPSLKENRPLEGDRPLKGNPAKADTLREDTF